MYAHRWVLKATAPFRSGSRPLLPKYWDGATWGSGRPERFNSEGDAKEELVACCGLAPQGWTVRAERETYLPSQEHGRQQELVGVRAFGVLKGGAPSRRPMEHGPFAPKS
jgi:hypothetical protein